MQDQVDKIIDIQDGHTEVLLEQSKSLSRIETALFGDEQAGIEGVVKSINTNKEYIDKDKKQKWYAAGFLAALALLKDKIVHLFFE